jgi:hypothetical protein
MAYPAPFHRLVLIGSLYSDIFNVTLSMVPGLSGTMPAVTTELAEDVRTFVEGWFNNPLSVSAPFGCGFTDQAILTSIKLNRIGTDGHYQDPVSVEVPTSEPFAGSSSNHPPAQLSVVATLRGAAPRALAGKGRMFLPPNHFSGAVGADGRITDANAQQYGDGVLALIYGLNDVYLTNSINSVVGIASKTRTGAFQSVTEVTIGKTVDTMRSRRNKIPEDFITLPV